MTDYENFSIITDQLAVGEAPPMRKLEALAKDGFNAVVDLRAEACDNERFLDGLGMSFLHVDIEDTDVPTMDQLNLVFSFVDPLLDSGKRIFVHCQNGYGRSPLVVAAILIHRGLGTSEALEILYDRHRVTTFTLRQEIFIRGLEETLMK